MRFSAQLALVLIIAGLLWAGAVLPHSLQVADPEKSWVVVIGVSNYTSEDVQPLRFAASDAKAVADFLLSERGGAVPPGRTQQLLEGEATREAVETTLGFLGEKVQEGDTVHIFMAGHGHLTPRGLGYFVPADGKLANVYASGVNFRALKDLVEENLAHTKVRVLMTDVCHAGRIGPEVLQPTAENQNRVNEYLSAIAPKAGTFLNLLASRPHEYSFESDDLRQGVFTHALLSALNGKAVSAGVPVVDTKSLVEFVKAEVPKLTGDQQNPVSNATFDPALPMAFLDRPGPVHPPPVHSSVVLRNTNRSAFEQVEWVDSRYRSRAIRRLPKNAESVELGSLPPGEVEFKFGGARSRSLKLTLKPGPNAPVDLLDPSLGRGPAPGRPVQVASLSPVIPAGRGLGAAQLPSVTTLQEAVLLMKLEAGTAISVDGTPYGTSSGPAEYLQLSGLAPGVHNLTLVPSAEREYRFRLRLFSGSQIFDHESGELRYVVTPQQDPAQVPVPPGVPPNLVAAYRNFTLALWEERLIAPQGNSAWDFFTQMRDAVPAALRQQLSERLIIAMGNRAQRTILKYLRGGDIRWNPAVFEEGAALSDRAIQFFQLKPAMLRDTQSRQAFFAGRAQVERGRYPEAIQDLQRAISLFPEASHAYNAIGLAYWKQGLLDQAIAPLQQAIQLSPRWTYPRNLLALVFLEQRRYNEAEQSMLAALQVNAEDSTSHHGLAQIYLLLGRVADAETRVRRAVEFHPGNAYAHETWGRLEQRRNNLDEAERFFRLAIRLEPDEPSFRVSLAELLGQRGRAAEAQQILARLAATNPADLRVVRVYSSLLATLNRAAEARTVFEQALKAAPKDANLRVAYGTFLRNQKREGDAERQFKEAIAGSPSNAFAHHELASLYLSQGKIAPAERSLNDATRADSRFPGAPKLLGQIRSAQKRFAEAAEAFGQAAALAVEPDQRQELGTLIGDARKAAATEAIASAQRDIERNRLRSAWSTYTSALRAASDDRALADAILRFDSDFSAEADPAALPASAIASALQTPFWAKLREAESLWKARRQPDAIATAVAALEGLSAADRRKVAGTAFNLGNEKYGIHQRIYSWASRMIELRDFEAAGKFADAAMRHRIFDAVPGLAPLTLDSLMIPEDAAEPKTFSDFEVAHHPDRRIHEIFAVLHAARGDTARSDEYLKALRPAEQAEVRAAIGRAVRR